MYTASQLHLLKLDELDLSILFQIVALRAASKLPNKGKLFEQKLNNLFLNLKRNFEENYDNVALKMGNLILASTLIQVLSSIHF